MSIAAMKQALEALELLERYDNQRSMLTDEAIEGTWEIADAAMDTLRSAIEQAEKQEPVAWIRWDDEENYYDVRRTTPPQEAIDYLAKWNRPAWVPAYPHPPQRQPLTEGETLRMMDQQNTWLGTTLVETEAVNRQLMEALECCLAYGSMTGGSWVEDRARGAIERAHGIGGGHD